MVTKEQVETAENALKPLKEQYSNLAWDKDLAIAASCALLLFTVLFFSVAAFLIIKGKPADDVMRAFTIPLICIMAVFLVLLGYSDSQIAPVIGLLGTIVGYLLGKRDTIK